jgi:DNA primase
MRYSRYKCPLHDEKIGTSLVVYSDHWRCYGKCAIGGDVIRWIQVYHNLSFREACEHLLSTNWPHSIPLGDLSFQHHQSDPPDSAWQVAASHVVETALTTLWDKTGYRALSYLKNKRGLSEDTILRAKLGYIPGDFREWRRIQGLNVPCGITIPWQADSALWGIKVRRAAGEPRYLQVAGGNIKSCLYLVDHIQHYLPVIVTEGEFDSLVVMQVGTDIISPVSIGSAAYKHPDRRWHRTLAASPCVLVRTDSDNAGEIAFEALATLFPRARRIQVPEGKDINDFLLIRGPAAVLAWIKAELTGSC